MHTKGPWIFQDHRGEPDSVHYDWHGGFTIRDKRNIHIATVGHVDAATIDEAEDNARLLAASTDLLKACKLVSDMLREESESVWSVEIAMLDTAIEKTERG